jgi:hypothetical protein
MNSCVLQDYPVKVIFLHSILTNRFEQFSKIKKQGSFFEIMYTEGRIKILFFLITKLPEIARICFQF